MHKREVIDHSNNYALIYLQEDEMIHCTIKQGPSNSLNMVIYRNLTQNVVLDQMVPILVSCCELRSFRSLSLLSESYRIINSGPYSVNYFLGFFLD